MWRWRWTAIGKRCWLQTRDDIDCRERDPSGQLRSTPPPSGMRSPRRPPSPRKAFSNSEAISSTSPQAEFPLCHLGQYVLYIRSPTTKFLFHFFISTGSGGPGRGWFCLLLVRNGPERFGKIPSPQRWTCKSVRNLADQLRAQGHEVSHMLVAELLHEQKYSLQANRGASFGQPGRPQCVRRCARGVRWQQCPRA